MGARLVVSFCDENHVPKAIVYDHWAADNREDADKCLDGFFAAIEDQCAGDTRYSDATMLAARFVAWRAAEYAKHEAIGDPSGAAKPLRFLSVRVVLEEDCGGEHLVRLISPPSPFYFYSRGPAEGTRPKVVHIGAPLPA